jgi:hypothetical protein
MDVPISYDNPQGLIRFSLPAGEHQVQVRFQDTPVRLWSTWLSLGAVVLLLLTLWLGKVRRGGRSASLGRSVPQPTVSP